jgi:hypothetical protein
MKKVFVLVYQILSISISLFSQKYEPVTVRAGMRVVDCFPFNERYQYKEFTAGRIQLNNGIVSNKMLNYDYLNGEMEYIKGKDTLAIANAKDIRLIVVATDTFCYYKGGFLQLITAGAPKVALKQYIKLKEVQKKDSYGTSSAGSATNSYGTLPVAGNFYKLVANEDMVFQRTLEYYISDPEGEFDPYNKKNVLHLYPQHEKAIKDYLKSNKINFDKKDDLLRLSGFLSNL